MTQFPDIFAALAAPFDSSEVKIRPQAGRQLSYITARTAMNRLDNVLGPENWWDEYIPSEHSVLCKLTIRLPDGSTLTKSDAGGYAGMSDHGDDDKSGFSDAFKRTAVKLGVARYLYRDGVPQFVLDREPGIANALADQAPAAEPTAKGSNDRDQGARSSTATVVGAPPRSGRALFAWVKQQEQRHDINLLQYLNKWGKLHEYPGRMIDWDAVQVENAYEEAIRKLQASTLDRKEAFEEALAN